MTNIKNETSTVETVTPKKRGRKPRGQFTATVEKSVAPIADISNLTIKDIKNHPIKKDEIRNAIETYYDMQDVRIRSGNRKNAIIRGEKKALKEVLKENPDAEYVIETPIYLQYMEDRFKETEKNVSKFLGYYAQNDPVGRWMMSIPGVGPVFAAGLLAYIDIKKCKTAGAIWAFAGWEGPRKVKKKGEKVTWNPKFRSLCWKIGESFVKVSGNENDIYGALYREKKAFYEKKNEEGGFAEKAAMELTLKNYDKNKETYKYYASGKLPPNHIHSMAKRFAVKMFLSHLFTLWYEYDRGVKPPNPFVQDHLGHVHIMPPPNREILFPDENK